MPSTDEGYGLAAVEAMACGTPALVFNARGLAEACGTAGLVIEPDSIESITAGIEQIVQDQTMRGRLQQKGLTWVAKLPWAESAARGAAVLRELPP